jgi:hypothetical protein
VEELCFRNEGQVERLTKVLSALPRGGGRPLGLGVRSIGFTFATYANSEADGHMFRLLGAVPRVEKVEFRVKGGSDLLPPVLFGRIVGEVLVRLEHVKHFAVLQAETRCYVEADILSR